jgi:hypothetical protein
MIEAGFNGVSMLIERFGIAATDAPPGQKHGLPDCLDDVLRVKGRKLRLVLFFRSCSSLAGERDGSADERERDGGPEQGDVTGPLLESSEYRRDSEAEVRQGEVDGSGGAEVFVAGGSLDLGQAGD